jgi:monovalent cation:H+ antiporter-2, CPA2 family
MPVPNAHEPVLIATIAIGLALAFVAGIVARRLRLPPIVGYLLAGVAVGPFTPGFVADPTLAQELAEIGVVLLMFSVGLHFSLRDLAAVRGVAIPGALGRIAIASTLGTTVGLVLGWELSEAVVLGLAISVASTVVLVRALTERGELLSAQGRIAVGWLVVEDVFTVVALVLLPSLAALTGATGAAADPWGILGDVAFAVLRAVLFAVLIVVIGVRVVPPLLAYVARLRDHELFTLAAVAIALGIAYLSASVFGVSLALGAFLAGAVVSESDTSHQVAADARPLREVFSVLFFVSVGILFDPGFLIESIPAVLGILVVVLVATPVAAFAIVTMLGQPPRVGLTVAAGLAQIGEFSFILATAAFALGLVPEEGVQLVLSAAIVSVTLNPLYFAAIDPFARRIATSRRMAALVGPRAGGLATLPEGDDAPGLRGHAVVIGSGRVGRLVIGALARRNFPFVVVSEDRHDVERLRSQGQAALFGDASNIEVLRHARIDTARVLVVAIPDEHASSLVIHHARDLNPDIDLVVRTHSPDQMTTLGQMSGSIQPIQGELELGVQMTRYTLRRFGVSTMEAEAIAEGLRRRGRPWPLESP